MSENWLFPAKCRTPSMNNCVYFFVAVTIYVKKEEEKVYNALMLDSLTVGDMVEAVSYLSSIYHKILHCIIDFLKEIYK